MPPGEASDGPRGRIAWHGRRACALPQARMRFPSGAHGRVVRGRSKRDASQHSPFTVFREVFGIRDSRPALPLFLRAN